MTNVDDIENAPYRGQPATIHLYTDTFAAVVVRVNAKSITLARVATDGQPVRINDEREPFPVCAERGILTEVIGETERYQIIHTRTGVRYACGSITATLGKSVRIVDYRY